MACDVRLVRGGYVRQGAGVLAPRAGRRARATLLRDLVEVWDRGLREPLPLFTKASAGLGVRVRQGPRTR